MGSDGILYYQYKEAQAERRPWVSAKISVGDITWDDNGANIQVEYELKNTGHSPAMHVQLESKAFPSIMPQFTTPDFELKKMLNSLSSDNHTSFGFTLFPEAPEVIKDTLIISREDIAKHIEFMGTFRSIGEPFSQKKSNARKAAIKSIHVGIAYAIDYGFYTGELHHQTYCMVDIFKVDPAYPKVGLAIPLNINISGKDVLPVTNPYGCQAS